MAHDGFSVTSGVRAIATTERRSPAAGMDFTTMLFTGLSVSVFLILLACVVTAAILFSQGV